MSKRKSIFVTAICAVMLLLIIFGLYALDMKAGFFAIVGVLALYGFAVCAVAFCQWLSEKPVEKLEPVVIGQYEDDETDASIDDIIEEIKAEIV